MTPPQIIFLVYDSRSGSTLIASRISLAIRDVRVTPELGFDTILARTSCLFDRQLIPELTARLYSSGDLRNLGISKENLDAELLQLDFPVSARVLIEKIVALWCLQSGVMPGSVVLVKNGSHIRHWRRIKATFGDDTRFIHIFRDPRAVINSKLRTRRPYYPHETMAWGGTLLSALRWRLYSQSMRKASSSGVAVLDLRYEDFITSVESELFRVATYCGRKLTGISKGQNSYEIPEQERHIHPLVDADKINSGRARIWQEQLARRDRTIVEATCAPEMLRRGYRLSGRFEWWRRFAIFMTAWPEAAGRISRHYLIRPS